jgi:hypothetical protein
MERRKAQHRCRRAPHGLARAMVSEARTALRRSTNVRASAKLHPRARTCTGGEPPMPSAAAFFSGRGSAQSWNGMRRLAARPMRRIVGAFAPRPPFRPMPQATAPHNGSGRVTSASRVARVRHEPRGRRASLRIQERLPESASHE